MFRSNVFISVCCFSCVVDTLVRKRQYNSIGLLWGRNQETNRMVWHCFAIVAYDNSFTQLQCRHMTIISGTTLFYLIALFPWSIICRCIHSLWLWQCMTERIYWYWKRVRGVLRYFSRGTMDITHTVPKALQMESFDGTRYLPSTYGKDAVQVPLPHLLWAQSDDTIWLHARNFACDKQPHVMTSKKI